MSQVSLSVLNSSAAWTSNSNDTEDFFCPQPPIPWTGARIQRTLTLSLLLVISLLGNLTIITLLTFSKRHKSLNRVNIFIINLAVGDLLIGIVTILSELILEVSGEWILGNLGCKTLMPAQILTLSSTTYILVAMSRDRYQAICQPLDFNPSTSRARKSCLVAWIAAGFSALPYTFIFVQVKTGIHLDGTDCFSCLTDGYTASWQRKLNFVWLTLSVFILPAIWIAFCYFSLARVVWQQATTHHQQNGDGLRKTGGGKVIPQAKMKTLKMSMSIVLTFVICWTPYFVVYNLLIFSNYSVSIPESVVNLADTMALTNSCINPFIYSCYNLKVKQGLSDTSCFQQALNVCRHNPQSQPRPQLDSMSEKRSAIRTHSVIPVRRLQHQEGSNSINQINTFSKKDHNSVRLSSRNGVGSRNLAETSTPL